MKRSKFPLHAFMGMCLALAWVSAASQGKTTGCLECPPNAGCPVIEPADQVAGL